MKRWISAFNAQGSRGIIVAVQAGAVKIYVAAVEVLRKKERQVKLRNHQNWWFSEFHPQLNANVLLCRGFFFNLTLCMTKLRVLVLSFADFTDISIMCLSLWINYIVKHHIGPTSLGDIVLAFVKSGHEFLFSFVKIYLLRKIVCLICLFCFVCLSCWDLPNHNAPACSW
jgi:hypothetical protein